MMKSGTVAAALALALLASTAHAQTATAYPTRTIKFIVGFAAGGGVDIVARLVAQKMQESFGQNVIVENRPGGNAMLGPDIAAKSAPDGYTLLYAAAGQMSVSPAIYTKIPVSAAQGLRADLDAGELSAADDRQPQSSGVQSEGLHRLDQGQSRQDELRRGVGRISSCRPNCSS